jgi:uncharacterized repeat protein (TIGR03837 family)
VVVEAFGCDPPPDCVTAMAGMPRPPVWLNLEYLSAESYVERSHGLPSPQRNGLTKWFYYPGFTARTGGLLREPGLMQRRLTFERASWLAGRGLRLRPGERVVSLFCYDNPALADLLHSLADLPTLLLLTQGPAQRQVQPLQLTLPPGLRVHALPWLDQADFDHLLWSSDLNFVRGEDSLVRALWAGSPLVWQLYPQDDGAHFQKLAAMLAWLDAGPDLAAVWRAWNGQPGVAWPGLPDDRIWRSTFETARRTLLGQADLATQLRAFVDIRRLPAC